MTTTTLTAPAVAPPPEEARAFVANVLDDLEIAERAYHHLTLGAPLVADLVSRSKHHASGRTLIIGGSALLVESVARFAKDLRVWQLSGTYLTEGAKSFVTRHVTTSALPDIEATDGPYDLIVLPLVLEALDEPNAQRLLRALRRMLAAHGKLLVATRNQAKLDLRLSAMRGKPFTPKGETAALSLGWPSTDTARLYHRDELRNIARGAGLHVQRCDAVTAEQSFMEMELLSVPEYALRKAGRLIRWALPTLRDVLILECARRPGDGAGLKTRIDDPTVSVVVSVRSGGAALRATLDAVQDQTYPAGLREIVVLDDGRHRDTPDIVAAMARSSACDVRRTVIGVDGPTSRNEVLAGLRSDISAHIEDTCHVPPDWIESAITWFDGDTAVITGPIFAADGSMERYLEVAGTRPDPDEKSPPSEHMFPITNTFYRNAVALAAGGFADSFDSQSGPRLGWDTELAWRLRRLGWNSRFREEVYQFRVFPRDAANAGWPRREMRIAAQVPMLLARAPEYANRTLVSGIFVSRQTMYFDLAAAGIALAAARRQRRWLLVAAPWVGTVSSRIDVWPVRNWPHSAKTVAGIGARQGLWLAGFVVGSIKARRIAL